MTDTTKELVQRALRDIVEGRANPQGRQESQKYRVDAQELFDELNRQQLRPGFYTQAQSIVEGYFRAVGLLAETESLTDPLEIRVKSPNGNVNTVRLQRTQSVGDMRTQVTNAGGFILSGRPLTDSERLYDLWLRDGVGSKRAGSNAPVIQVVVRNVGG